MPGKLCNGSNEYSGRLVKDSKAYCEGREYAAGSGLVGDNPFPADTETNVAWTAGFNSWVADPAAGPGVDCCAIAYGGGYTP